MGGIKYVLKITGPGSLSRSFDLNLGKELTLGNSKSMDVIIKNINVSEHHCTFKFHNTILLIDNMARGQFTTLIEGHQLRYNRAYAIAKGTKIQIGNSDIHIFIDGNVDEEDDFEDGHEYEHEHEDEADDDYYFESDDLREEEEEEEEIGPAPVVEGKEAKNKFLRAFGILRDRISDLMKKFFGKGKKGLPEKKIRKRVTNPRVLLGQKNKTMPHWGTRFVAVIANFGLVGVIYHILLPGLDFTSFISFASLDSVPYLNLIGPDIIKLYILYVSFDVCSHFLFATSLPLYVMGVRQTNSFVMDRVRGVFYSVIGAFTLPFLIFDLPLLFDRRSFKEILSGVQLVHFKDFYKSRFTRLNNFLFVPRNEKVPGTFTRLIAILCNVALVYGIHFFTKPWRDLTVDTENLFGPVASYMGNFLSGHSMSEFVEFFTVYFVQTGAMQFYFLFVAFDLLSHLILGVSLPLFLMGVHTADSFWIKRLKGLICSSIGALTLPFVVFDLPVFFGRRSFKEFFLDIRPLQRDLFRKYSVILFVIPTLVLLGILLPFLGNYQLMNNVMVWSGHDVYPTGYGTDNSRTGHANEKSINWRRELAGINQFDPLFKDHFPALSNWLRGSDLPPSNQYPLKLREELFRLLKTSSTLDFSNPLELVRNHGPFVNRFVMTRKAIVNMSQRIKAGSTLAGIGVVSYQSDVFIRLTYEDDKTEYLIPLRPGIVFPSKGSF